VACIFYIYKNKVFCFYCKLFASSKIKLASDGYNDWRHIGRTLKEHKTSNTHLNSYKTYIELVTRLNTNKTIDDTNQKIMESEQEYWTNVLQRIISVVKILAQQSLAFWGSSDKLYEHNNGNFLKIIELLAKYDSIISEHIRRTLNNQNNAHYLGKNIQN